MLRKLLSMILLKYIPEISVLLSLFQSLLLTCCFLLWDGLCNDVSVGEIYDDLLWWIPRNELSYTVTLSTQVQIRVYSVHHVHRTSSSIPFCPSFRFKTMFVIPCQTRNQSYTIHRNTIKPSRFLSKISVQNFCRLSSKANPLTQLRERIMLPQRCFLFLISLERVTHHHR